MQNAVILVRVERNLRLPDRRSYTACKRWSFGSRRSHGVVSQRAVAALLAKINLAAGWDLGTTLTDAASGTYSKMMTPTLKLL
jgi:hypothetical protein